MASFDLAIPVILKHEGVESNLRGDPGGKTLWGISSAFCIRQCIALPATEADAVSIYRRFFWQDVYDDIKDQQVATKVFDDHVNQGSIAVPNLQKALNKIGHAVPVTGFFGPKTLAETNAADPEPLIHAFQMIQRDEYTAWVERDAKERTDLLNGLWNRAAWPRTQTDLGWNAPFVIAKLRDALSTESAVSTVLTES